MERSLPDLHSDPTGIAYTSGDLQNYDRTRVPGFHRSFDRDPASSRAAIGQRLWKDGSNVSEGAVKERARGYMGNQPRRF